MAIVNIPGGDFMQFVTKKDQTTNNDFFQMVVEKMNEDPEMKVQPADIVLEYTVPIIDETGEEKEAQIELAHDN